MRSAVLAIVLSLPSIASAQCRPATAGDTATAAAWSLHADGIAVGRCSAGPAPAWCFFIGSTHCMTRIRGDHVDASTMSVAGARVLVLRWTTHSMVGSISYDGNGTEVWRVDRAPSRVLAILESYSVTDVDMARAEPRTLCLAGRSLELTGEHVAIGSRETTRCRHVPTTDRRDGRGIGPQARTWTWAELLGR